MVLHGLRTGLMRMDRNADPAISAALRIIEREALHGLQPETLARRVHVGYSTLRRHFKQQTGYAIKEYILGVQLRRAKELLATSLKTIGEIAQECGFENGLYFSRLFTQKEGVRPSKFREQHRR